MEEVVDYRTKRAALTREIGKTLEAMVLEALRDYEWELFGREPEDLFCEKFGMRVSRGLYGGVMAIPHPKNVGDAGLNISNVDVVKAFELADVVATNKALRRPLSWKR